MTAAAACAAGMKIALVLTKDCERPVVQGNLFLDQLFGAEIHWIDENPNPLFATGADEAAKIAEVIANLEKRGERPYLIPIGGSSPRGSFGYVTGTLELVSQLFQNSEAPSRLYFPNGSRGTQAGLALGAKMHSAPYRIYGIAVSGGEPEKTQRAVRIAREAATILGVQSQVTAEDLINDEDYIGPGYGIATPGCVEAIRMLATAEGILLDPVYTGKAMAGMIGHIRRGDIEPAETIVFLHTGGTPALFAHVDDFGLD
jgi:1-aminocyclopropane-1-carboxylate deaminase/D-cysteine desulfhydrase-like pyridoxal-dependent ACC family enzyme